MSFKTRLAFCSHQSGALRLPKASGDIALKGTFIYMGHTFSEGAIWQT